MKLFISSTFIDLRAEREAVQQALYQMGVPGWGMELFLSQPDTPLNVALRELGTSDGVVLIIGFRAGTLISADGDLTFTRAEFERAVALNLPIFVFLKTRGGTTANDETDPCLQDALDAFKAAVRSTKVTPDYFEEAHEISQKVILSIHKWNEAGRPGARKTFASAEEYYPSPTGMVLFDHTQSLVGRSDEVSSLNDFLIDANKTVGLLPGRGGIGKSKLLLEWLRGVTGWQPVILKEGAIWHAESHKEIPFGNALIVVDDAHRAPELQHVLALAHELKQSRPVKLLLTARPSGMSSVDGQIARIFDASHVLRFPALEKLSRPQVRELAAEVLGPDHAVYLGRLTELSADTPLVTVVGGRLIRQGKIEPDTLVNEGVFRGAVFDKFLEEFEQKLPSGPVHWRGLLSFIAALQPLHLQSEAFATAEKFLDKRKDELITAIDILTKHGLLIRGGDLVRIVPDVLADYLLETACVDQTGQSTSYADALFNAFERTDLPALLRNLAELDWRITQIGSSAGLLSNILATLRERFISGDARDRMLLLKQIGVVAFFRPDEAYELVDIALTKEAAKHFYLADWAVTNKDVLDQVPYILETIAYHEVYTREAAEKLWKLGQENSGERLNPYHKGAARALDNLSRFSRYKPVTFNEVIVDWLADLSSRHDAYEGLYHPLKIATVLLEREVACNDLDGLTFSIGSVPLNYRVVRTVREKALRIVESALFHNSPRAQTEALHVISRLLHSFLPTIRELTDEERAWQDQERLDVLGIVGRRVQATMPLGLAACILNVLRDVSVRATNQDVATLAGGLLSNVKITDELVAFDAFTISAWHRHPRLPPEEADRGQAEAIAAGIDSLKRQHSTPGDQIRAIEAFAADARAYQIDYWDAASQFASKLCADEAFLRVFTEILLSRVPAGLEFLINAGLRTWRERDIAAYGRFGVAAAGHPNETIASATAQAVSYGTQLNNPVLEDAAILAKLVENQSSSARQIAFTGLGRIGRLAEFRAFAISTLLNVDIGDEPRMAEEFCGAFGNAYIPYDALEQEHVKTIVDKLIRTRAFDGIQTHHVPEFIRWASTKYPLATFDFVLRRFDHAKTLEGSGYKPLSFQNLGFDGIRNTPQYGPLLRRVRDSILDHEEKDWFADLFWDIGTDDMTALECLDEWFHSGDRTKIETSIHLIQKGPAEIVFRHPAYAAHILELSAAVDEQLARNCGGALTANAFTGGYGARPGDPPPRMVSLRERCKDLKNTYGYSRWAVIVFDEIDEMAAGYIRQSLKQHAEMTL